MTNDELAAIGQQLRVVRLERGYSLQDVATATKIRPKFLESLEAGEADPSLSEMQLRGFLRNYAAFLHLDLDAMLAAYRQLVLERQKRRSGVFRSRTPAQPLEAPIIPLNAAGTLNAPAHSVPRVVTRPITGQLQPVVVADEPRRGGILRWLVGGVLLMAVLAAVGVIALPLLANQFEASSLSEAVTTAPLAIQAETTLPAADTKWQEAAFTPTVDLTPTVSGVILSTPAQPNMTGAQTVSIAITALQRSWVRVTVDGAVEYEGLLRPGTGLQYQGQQSISLRTSNAGGLEVVVNNQPLGSLGGRGELFERTFSLNDATSTDIVPIVLTATLPPDTNLPTPLPVPTLIVTPAPLTDATP